MFTPLVHAQSIPVTGNLKDLSGSNATAPNTYVQFTLENYMGGTSVPEIVNTGIFVNPSPPPLLPNSSGVVSGTIVPNDQISPPSTYYQACIYFQGMPSWCQNYLVVTSDASLNLNTHAVMASPPGLTSPFSAVVTNPTGTQNIVQPVGTQLQVNGVAVNASVVGGPNTWPFAQTFNGNLTATAGQNSETLFNLNNTIYVDGNKYPCSAAGWNLATAALGGLSGTVDAGFCSLTTTTLTASVAFGNGGSQAVRFKLPSGAISCAMTSGNCFNVQGGGSSLIGPGVINLIISCTGSFVGDFVNVSGPGGVPLNSIEIAGFRTDHTNCPASKWLNADGIRDPSSIHNVGSYFWTGTTMQIIPSVDTTQMTSGISIRDVYMLSGSGALTADSSIISGGQVEITSTKVISGSSNTGSFKGMVWKPSVTPSGDGRATDMRSSSIAGQPGMPYSIGLSVEAPAGAATGVLGCRIIGNTFENDTLAYQLTGADASHRTTGCYGAGNMFTGSTINEVKLDFANKNIIMESSNGGAGDIACTANSTNNSLYITIGGTLADVSCSSGTNTRHEDLAGVANVNEIPATVTVVTGTSTLPSALITAGSCGTTVTTTATGATTGDSIEMAFASAPASSDSRMPPSAWVTSGNVNFNQCNGTAGSLTPTGLVINWRVVR